MKDILKAHGQDFFDRHSIDSSNLDGVVNGYSVTELKAKIATVISDYPEQKFDSATFDVRPTTQTQRTYVRKLSTAAQQKMQTAESSTLLLKQIFGDGDVDSQKSATAAATAKTKFKEARENLRDSINSIYLDTGGVARRVGIGGYANYDKKIFLLVQSVVDDPPNRAIATLVHESMHLAHSEIKDAAGYASIGLPFIQASTDAKLKNADHYAEVIHHLDNEGVNPVPYKPVDPDDSGGAKKTSQWDNGLTMSVRKKVMNKLRLLWSGAADLFLDAVRSKRGQSTRKNKKTLSRLLNMTYHNKSWKQWDPDLTDVDLSLAEATVNRIKTFTGSLTRVMKASARNVYEYVVTKLADATGSGATQVENAGTDIVADKGEDSAELKPEDKQPSAKTRFSQIARPG